MSIQNLEQTAKRLAELLLAQKEVLGGFLALTCVQKDLIGKEGLPDLDDNLAQRQKLIDSLEAMSQEIIPLKRDLPDARLLSDSNPFKARLIDLDGEINSLLKEIKDQDEQVKKLLTHKMQGLKEDIRQNRLSKQTFEGYYKAGNLGSAGFFDEKG